MLSVLAPIASLLGIELESLKQRLQRHAVIYGIMAALGLICVVFLLVAANSALSLVVGPVVAPLIIAGGALFLVLVVFLVGALQDSAQARREAEEKKSVQTSALLTSVAMTSVPMLLKSPLIREIGIPAGGALLAAWLLSRRDKNDGRD